LKPATPVMVGLEPYELKIGGPEAGQPQYVTLHALRSTDGRVMSRWELTKEEREWIAGGESDIFVTIWCGGQYPPTLVQVMDKEGHAELLRADMKLDDELEYRARCEDFNKAKRALEECHKRIYGAPEK
jgi:hypothetical protein